jgi:hypothetical protein
VVSPTEPGLSEAPNKTTFFGLKNRFIVSIYHPSLRVVFKTGDIDNPTYMKKPLRSVMLGVFAVFLFPYSIPTKITLYVKNKGARNR